MADPPYNNYVQAVHNESYPQVLRLNNIWEACNNLSSSGQLERWRWKLDTVWRELYPAAMKLDETIPEDKEQEKWVKQKENIDNEITNAKERDTIYKALCKKEEFLRLLQDKAGKGAKWKTEGDDDFD